MTPQKALAAALAVISVPESYEAWQEAVDRSYESDAAVILAALADAGMSIVPTEVVRAARWLVGIHADDIAIERGSALWEDLQALRAALAESPCWGCGGRRWTDDENWTPDDPRAWRGERTQSNGLIPCDVCNFAGWATPLDAPEAP